MSGHCVCGRSFADSTEFYSHVAVCDGGLSDDECKTLVDFLAEHGDPWRTFPEIRTHAGVMAAHVDPYGRVCPTCGAPPLRRCLSRTDRPTTIHPARVRDRRSRR